MSTNSNSKKSQQLGMPFGTATNKLRKKVMFSLLVRHRENICFKCSKDIETENELSIEHKKDWLDVGSELFWDIDNIAFSHLKCNKPRKEFYESTRKNIVDGKQECFSCKTFKPISEFWKNRTRHSGIDSQCKDCVKRYRRSKK
jgi:hypothetical protein